jgi:hypothetical protein
VLRYVRVGTLPEGQTPEDEQWLTEEIEMDDFLEREPGPRGRREPSTPPRRGLTP